MKVLKEDEMVVTFGNENNEPLLIMKKEALPKQRGERVYIITQFYYRADRI